MRKGVGWLSRFISVERAGDQFVALLAGNVLVAQAEVDVLAHGLPRKQRKMLEHHGAVGARAA